MKLFESTSLPDSGKMFLPMADVALLVGMLVYVKNLKKP